VAEGRLVTLSGEAGIGKTRLAQHFAHEQRSAYETAGGVWFCDLRDARDVEGMCSTLARTLNIADEATIVGDGAVTAVGRALATRGRALVVLDNLEQLLPDGASVVLRWLDLAREARFLVTSREPLYLLGEELVELSALSLPDDAAPEGDAVRLFVERVRALRDAYTPSGDEPAAIRDLVLRLRGVPLAIEICASRLGSGDVRSVLGAAEVRGGARSIAWSFRRLLPWERETLAQCSVFHGGFTPEAASHVVRLDHDERAVADVLSVLLHKSLIQTARAEIGVRYALCEGIRAAAAELLDQGEGGAATRQRHAQYFLDRSSGPLTDFPATAASAQTRDELAADRENLEAVLELGAATRRADLVIRAAIALEVIAAGTGLSRAHLARLDNALTTSTRLDPSLTGRALALRAGALWAGWSRPIATRSPRSGWRARRRTGGRSRRCAWRSAGRGSSSATSSGRSRTARRRCCRRAKTATCERSPRRCSRSAACSRRWASSRGRGRTTRPRSGSRSITTTRSPRRARRWASARTTSRPGGSIAPSTTTIARC
jgi:predicted ATPase